LVVDFEREPFGTAHLYKSISTTTCPPITAYLWEVKDADTDTVIAQFSGAGPDITDFIYNWPYFGNFSVTLTAADSCSSVDSETKNYNDEGPIGGGGGGAPPSYVGQQKEEKDEHMHVISVYFEETKPLPKIIVKILGGVMMK
jgi:hypothetical protein